MPLPPAEENPATLADLCSASTSDARAIYVDQTKVGEGACGSVYRARMRPAMNEVAIKVMQINRQNAALVANEISIMKVPADSVFVACSTTNNRIFLSSSTSTNASSSFTTHICSTKAERCGS